MLPTEVLRVVLLIALGVVGYLLILQWNEDYMQRPPAPEYTAEPSPSVADTALTAAPDEPLAGDLPADTGASDIPDESLIGPEGAEAQTTVSVPTPDIGERLVVVRTPLLQVWIDRLGGDVVRVALPKYPVDLDRPDVPFVLLDNSLDRTYVAQSGLIGPDGIDAGGDRPLYVTDAQSYTLEAGELVVELSALRDGLEVAKRYTFTSDDYLMQVAYQVRNLTGRTISARMFGQLKRDRNEPYVDSSIALGPQPYLGAALTTAENRYEKLDFDDLDEGRFRTTEQGGWVAFLQHYFLSAWVANPDETNSYYGQRRPDGTYMFGFSGPVSQVASGAVGQWTASLYVGPKDQKRLEEIADNLNLTVDYGFLWWLAVPLFYLLDWLHGFVGNWGVAIILLTVLVKLVLYPLSAASYKSMANMRRVAPQMKRLQERHADDRQKLSQEMMALYKKEQVNPLGGCLPMLLPMPIFIALYWVLFESVELRQAPFALWINDLAAMDKYFVLPLLMGASMYLQQLLSPAVGDPMQVRMMRLMPVMFTVLFLFFPAGLVLYWLVNSVLSIAQQWYVIRQTERAQAARS